MSAHEAHIVEHPVVISAEFLRRDARAVALDWSMASKPTVWARERRNHG
jgi:hypothetical protein